MKSFDVVSPQNLPGRPPVSFTLVMFLLLDRFNATGWLWGVTATLIAILWVIYFVGIYQSEFRRPRWEEKS